MSYGTKTSAAVGHGAADARPVADDLPGLREPTADGPSRPSKSDDLAGSVCIDFEALSLPEPRVPTFSAAVSAGRRRRLGLAAWRIWAGCHCPGGHPALSAAAQYPPDPRGTGAARPPGGATHGHRSALSL